MDKQSGRAYRAACGRGSVRRRSLRRGAVRGTVAAAWRGAADATGARRQGR